MGRIALHLKGEYDQFLLQISCFLSSSKNEVWFVITYILRLTYISILWLLKRWKFTVVFYLEKALTHPLFLHWFPRLRISSWWPGINLANLWQRLLGTKVPWRKMSPIISKRNVAWFVVRLKKNSCSGLLTNSSSQRIKCYRTTELSKAARYQQWGLFLPIVNSQESDHKDSKIVSRQLGVSVTQTTNRRKSSIIFWEGASPASQHKA